MTVKTMYCDRCKKEIDMNEWRSISYKLYTFKDERIDLCQDCHNELVKWFNKEDEQ